jgi:hypothetical protein
VFQVQLILSLTTKVVDIWKKGVLWQVIRDGKQFARELFHSKLQTSIVAQQVVPLWKMQQELKLLEFLHKTDSSQSFIIEKKYLQKISSKNRE